MALLAPYLPTYAARKPYITAKEFAAYPTGVTVSQLVPGASAAVNADALNQQILAASGWADSICAQTLAATVETVADWFLLQKGYISIVADQTPVIQVNSISYGAIDNQQALSNWSQVSINSKVVQFPITTFPTSSNPYSVPVRYGSDVWCVMEYVAGYANALTVAQAAAGQNTLNMTDTLGIAAGMAVTIYDPGKTEVITIQSIDSTGTIITTVGPLLFEHDAGTSVGALPASIKEAVVLLTTSLIKSRGSDAIVLPSMRAQPSSEQAVVTPSGAAERRKAEAMLAPFMRSM